MLLILCPQPVSGAALRKYLLSQLRDRHNPHQRIGHKALFTVCEILRIKNRLCDVICLKQIFPQDAGEKTTGEGGSQDCTAANQKQVRGGAFAKLPFGV